MTPLIAEVIRRCHVAAFKRRDTIYVPVPMYWQLDEDLRFLYGYPTVDGSDSWLGVRHFMIKGIHVQPYPPFPIRVWDYEPAKG